MDRPILSIIHRVSYLLGKSWKRKFLVVVRKILLALEYVGRRERVNIIQMSNSQESSDGSRISQRRERQTQGGCQPIFWPIFPENCLKMKKFWARGGARHSRPLRSTTGMYSVTPQSERIDMIGNDQRIISQNDFIFFFIFFSIDWQMNYQLLRSISKYNIKKQLSI